MDFMIAHETKIVDVDEVIKLFKIAAPQAKIKECKIAKARAVIKFEGTTRDMINVSKVI